MSRIKRYLEDEIARIADKSGYSWGFLFNVAMEQFEDDGMIDLEHIEQVAMEGDF